MSDSLPHLDPADEEVDAAQFTQLISPAAQAPGTVTMLMTAEAAASILDADIAQHLLPTS